MIDYEKVKKAIVKNRKVLLSSNYPKEFLEELLDRYIRDLPFYYTKNFVYTLSLNPFGNIYLGSVINLSSEKEKTYFPLFHAYWLSKATDKNLTGLSHWSLKKFIENLKRYGYIKKISNLYQICLVDENNLFIGYDNSRWDTIFTKLPIPPLFKIEKKISVKPFWIEILCQDLSCINTALEILPLKGIVALYTNNESLLRKIANVLKGLNIAVDTFIAYELNKEKLGKVFEKRKKYHEDIEVIFNPFGYKFKPLKIYQ